MSEQERGFTPEQEESFQEAREEILNDARNEASELDENPMNLLRRDAINDDKRLERMKNDPKNAGLTHKQILINDSRAQTEFDAVDNNILSDGPDGGLLSTMEALYEEAKFDDHEWEEDKGERDRMELVAKELGLDSVDTKLFMRAAHYAVYGPVSKLLDVLEDKPSLLGAVNKYRKMGN